MATGPRKPGEFCWINMLTPDPAKARSFFGTLLRWTYGEIPGMGHFIEAAGKHVGGLFDLHGPGTPPGLPPAIGVMVKVTSADAIAERARAVGGSAKPAFDIAESGRMAECTDPTGAQLDVWEPKRMGGTEVDTSRHGAPSWFELLTTDTGRAARFYGDVFGWTAEVMPLPDMQYTTFKLGESLVGGMMAITPDMRGVPPHWGVYFTVDDVDATAREAERLGGTLFVPLRDIPGVGRFCGIVSPQGVRFYAITYAAR